MNGHWKTRVLFVCMGNICRSPVAEGLFRHLLQNAGLTEVVGVDSAGTHSYHEGAAPDERSQATASRRGVDLSTLRARRVVPEDFDLFDYVLAMDRANYQDLLSLCPRSELQDKIRLFMDYAPDRLEREVPDPYYGGLGGFERVMDLVEEAAQGLLLQLRERHRL
ncbi:MAG: low molecular weight phosphotyrosine protein phosphatase [Candidatus Competibacteraceae bacterium]|nr:low molecular weight phosphotyrosine protein phosphatase [Candidatus Competibacteraceae bacterium]